MGQLYSLLGLNTLELIRIGSEKSSANEWTLWDHEGPILNLRLLRCGDEPKHIMLPKDFLEKLYSRFIQANPKGTVIVVGEDYLEYSPLELSEAEVEELCDDEMIFQLITMDINYSLCSDPNRDTALHRYLPELRHPEVLERLATDPEASQELMSQAYKEGVLSMIYGPRHKRWSPEWAAYVEAYKKAHPTS